MRRVTTAGRFLSCLAAFLLSMFLMPLPVQGSPVADLVKVINSNVPVHSDGSIDIFRGGVGGTHATLNGKLYYAALTDSSGFELWVSDGTAAGTHLIKDIWPGPRSSVPANFAVLDGKLYFTARDAGRGYGLFKSDGTATGTRWVTSITGDDRGSRQSPQAVYAFGGKLWILANSKLYISDGTAAGTSLVADAGFVSVTPVSLFVGMNGVVYFDSSDGPGSETTLWRSDGTVAGTRPVDSSVTVGFSFMRLNAVVGDKLFFRSADDKLWVSDGVQVQEFVPRLHHPVLADRLTSRLWMASSISWTTTQTTAISGRLIRRRWMREF